MATRFVDCTLAFCILAIAGCSSDSASQKNSPDGSLASGGSETATGGTGAGSGGSNGSSGGSNGSGGAANGGAPGSGGGTPDAGLDGGSGGTSGTEAGAPGYGGAYYGYGGAYYGTGYGGAYYGYGGAYYGTGGTDAGDVTTPVDAGNADAAAVTCGGINIVSVTKDGSVAATSNAGDGYFPAMAVDGDVTTGWYGAFNDTSPTFTWTGAHDECITRIQTTNTASISFAPWKNWGFLSVTVSVLDGKGVTVFASNPITLGDPNINVDVAIPSGGVVGRKVVLAFSGIDNVGLAGGITEVAVSAAQ